ncbi:fructosamine kinase family protein [Actinomyces timonensis]|uniref:Fructosamine kinase family protein n=1 Tax=Actinomyces timonensis TaxID=1288391 RepID=A0AAU8N3I1_9ACTO
MSASVFRKVDEGPVSTAVEAQGLSWLAEAMPDGGAHVVPVTQGEGWIEEPRLSHGGTTAEAAEAFGRALAVTHAAGAPFFGASPPGWDGIGQMGRSRIQLRPHDSSDPAVISRPWGAFYAEDRIGAYIADCRDSGALSEKGARVLERVCSRLADGVFDSPQPALVEAGATARGQARAVSRTHGDLWCGNVLWVPVGEADWAPPGTGLGPRLTGGAARAAAAGSGSGGGLPGDVGVLIDPMAQGAHAETDLAALGMFGQSHLTRIIGAYNEVSPLADGWRERVGLHRLHMLMIHVFLFGGGYGMETVNQARQYM